MTQYRGEKHVLILVPDGQGGINRLFEQMFNVAGSQTSVDINVFLSVGEGRWRAVLFPIQLLRFFAFLLFRKPDLCHINVASKGSTFRKMIYALICRAAGVPYILHLHGGLYREFYAQQSAWMRNRIDSLFCRAERVVVLGSVWREFIVTCLGVQSSRCVILPNAVGGPVGGLRLSKSSGASHFLFLGRLGPPKGVPELIEALASSPLSSLRWTAKIAGDGDVDHFRELVHEHGLGDRVDLPGWVGPEDAHRLLEQSDVLVLPSHAENLPLSMLEGMGYGLCPVVTPVGAVTDVIRDEENGLLVPVNNADALASALVRLIKDEDLLHRLQARARSDFEAHYDIRNYREKLETIYFDVLEPSVRA